MSNAALKKFPLTAELRASVQITEQEIDARAIMVHARRHNSTEGRGFFGLCNVFQRNWQSALTKQQISLHLCGELRGEMVAVEAPLAKMVRDGYLRSSMSGGERVWEIAY